MDDRDLHFEDVLPTDRFAVQDMFLIRLHRLGERYIAVIEPNYRQGVDPRALLSFWSAADEFFIFAYSNLEKHLSGREMTELAGYFEDDTQISAGGARRIYILINKFATASKLTEISERRFKGPFSYARRELGIMRERGDRDTTEGPAED